MVRIHSGSDLYRGSGIFFYKVNFFQGFRRLRPLYWGAFYIADSSLTWLFVTVDGIVAFCLTVQGDQVTLSGGLLVPKHFSDFSLTWELQHEMMWWDDCYQLDLRGTT
ncbi:hypothetical protein Droror1_Dr00024563 [Drosera rotundifolia]